MRPFTMFLFGKNRVSIGVVSISSQNLGTTATSPSVATVNISFNSDKSITSSSDGPLAEDHWLTGGSVGNYDIRVTPTIGTFSSGTTATWLSLSASRQWTVSRGSVGNKSCTATFEIRDASTLAVLDTATITLDATQEAL